jgi:DNA-binding beta-propeller fold protein YncE
LFVSSDNPTSESSRIGKYTISGATVNRTLIPFVGFMEGIAVSGDKLFVADAASGLVAEYTTSGMLVNAALITGLNDPSGIAVFGGHLFVTSFSDGTGGEYDAATGAPINTALVSGLNGPFWHRRVRREFVCHESSVWSRHRHDW